MLSEQKPVIEQENFLNKEMQTNETREYKHNGDLVVVYKMEYHSGIYFVGQQICEKLQQYVNKEHVGAFAKVVKPHFIKGAEDNDIDSDFIIGIISNGFPPKDFKRDVLEKLHENDFIDKELLDSF